MSFLWARLIYLLSAHYTPDSRTHMSRNKKGPYSDLYLLFIRWVIQRTDHDYPKRHSLESFNEGKYNNLDKDVSAITEKFTETFWTARRTYSKYKSYGCHTNGHWISCLKPECEEVNQLESFVRKVQGFILLVIMFIFSKQELRSIKRHLKYQLSSLMILYMLFNVIQ